MASNPFQFTDIPSLSHLYLESPTLLLCLGNSYLLSSWFMHLFDTASEPSTEAMMTATSHEIIELLAAALLGTSYLGAEWLFSA